MLQRPNTLWELKPRFALDDLILSEQNALACRDFVEEQRRADELRELSLTPRHKISLAEAIAQALELPFFVVRYESLIGQYLGETSARLAKVIEYAKAAPCVLFFDEFDAVGKERSDKGEVGEIKRIVASLLMQIDDLPDSTVAIAATNHGELLDRAIWRRFQLKLTLNPPNARALADHLDRFANEFKDPSEVDVNRIAEKLDGTSFAEMIDFMMDIRRKRALHGHERAPRAIVEECLNLWTRRPGPGTT